MDTGISLRAFLDSFRKDVSTDPDMPLSTDMTHTEIAKLWLAKSLLKKWEATNNDADSLALSKFLACNEHCRTVRIEPGKLFHDVILNEQIDLLDRLLHRGDCGSELMTFGSFSQLCQLGSGMNLKSKTGNFYTKLFDSPLTSTSDSLYRFYGNAISTNPTWVDAENARALSYGCEVVGGSQLSFVPKTIDISRTICTEPTLNMFFQRGIGEFIESSLLSRVGIDLSTQPDKNRALARLGSVDGSFATIDLRSASDCISRELVAKIFPSYFVRWLDRTRSPSTVLPDGTKVELNMVSSMGNGFTFPLQTLIFASLVLSVYKILGIRPVYPHKESLGNFGVFGDDIIVRKDAYALTCEMLGLLGFFVNGDKSFNEGLFRESCGGDFFEGTDIRGVYVKKLSQDVDVYSAYNRLSRWAATHSVDLTNTLSFLAGKARFIPVPPREDDTAGFKVPEVLAVGSYSSLETQSVCYHALRARAESIELPEGHDEAVHVTIPLGPRGRRGVIRYNTQGLVVSLVGGFIRNGALTIRSDHVRYRKVRCTVPCWDWHPPSETADIRRQGFGYHQRWEALVKSSAFAEVPGA